jgi:hypothetical protein
MKPPEDQLESILAAAVEGPVRDQAGELLRDGIKRGLHTPLSLNNLAWSMATNADRESREPDWALLSKLAVEREPGNGVFLNTLGTAHYRTGNWKVAIDILKKADDLSQGEYFAFNALFIAMSCRQLGDKDSARKWHTAGVRWTEKYAPKSDELRRFRAEAAELLGLPLTVGRIVNPSDPAENSPCLGAAAPRRQRGLSQGLRGHCRALRQDDRRCDSQSWRLELHPGSQSSE